MLLEKKTVSTKVYQQDSFEKLILFEQRIYEIN
jgi:hypothetical protein